MKDNSKKAIHPGRHAGGGKEAELSPKPVPPLPPAPDFGEKPPSSIWPLVLAGVTLLFVMIGLSFLTLGYFAFVPALGIAIFLLIGLQYLVWGWWFERIYRRGKNLGDD
jgi:hypothetical protein